MQEMHQKLLKDKIVDICTHSPSGFLTEQKPAKFSGQHKSLHNCRGESGRPTDWHRHASMAKSSCYLALKYLNFHKSASTEK